MKTGKLRSSIAIAILALFSLMSITCGGGSSSARVTALSIKLPAAAAGAITVAKVRVTISGPNMETITRTVDASGPQALTAPQPYIATSIVNGFTVTVVNFDVPNGKDRRVVVETMDAAGNTVHQGDVLVDLDGTPKSVDVVLGINVSGNWKVVHPGWTDVNHTDVIAYTQVGNSIVVSGDFIGTGNVVGNAVHLNFFADKDCAEVTASGTISADGTLADGTFTATGTTQGGCKLIPGSKTGTWHSVKVVNTPTPPPPPTAPPTPAPAPPPPGGNPLPAGFPSNIPTGNYNISIQVCAAGTCYSGGSFVQGNVDINQFANDLLAALNAASNQSYQQECQAAGCVCSPWTVSYKPWNGTSFTINADISVTCGGQTVSATVQFIVTKM